MRSIIHDDGAVDHRGPYLRRDSVEPMQAIDGHSGLSYFGCNSFQRVYKAPKGYCTTMRVSAVFLILCALVLFSAACSAETEVTREVPVTVEVTREVSATVEVTREVPATVEVTREVPATVEVTREVPATVEVTREVPATVEVTREVPVTVEVIREIPVEVIPKVPVTVEVIREIPVEVIPKVPVTVEVIREITVEVIREVPVTVEVIREVPALNPGQHGQALTGGRLKLVRDRGKVICASRNDVPGFGFLDATGRNAGFDIDLCRAVAAAVLGDPNAVDIRLISAPERGPTIQSGEVDLLVRTTTWTATRDAEWGNYAQTMFYDGQGFLVRRDLGLTSAVELRRASVCTAQGTTMELNLQRFSNRRRLDIELLTFEDTDAAFRAYRAAQCDAFTSDRSHLAALSTVLDDPASYTILPETISEEPLGPVVPHGDDQWFDIVKTVMAILIHGEAYGITSDAVPSTATNFAAVDRLLGLQGSFGQGSLGLSRTVAQDVLRAVGNYGEIYERNLGSRNIGLPREGTSNALWAEAPCDDCPKGGQIYAAPLR